jgi:carbamoyl-phosphate synthase large subunit
MDENNKITILLTSAGGLTGVFLSKHFKKTAKYRIIAIDMTEVNPLKKWVDAFYKVPSVKDNNFIPIVKRILLDEKVDIIIPVTSYDVDLFSRMEIREQCQGVKMLLMDYEDHRIFNNKKTCYEYLRSFNIKTPSIFERIEDAVFPCILKPAIGSGSKNIIKINDLTDYNYWSKKIKDYILVQYLEGKEYTVDCLFDKYGICQGANVRERVKTNGGGAVVTRNEYSIDISNLIRKLESTKKIKGPINFQFKITSNGECYVFDFNTRFASGGLPLTIESGFDIPNKLVQLLLNDKAELWHPNLSKNGKTMIRYYEEYFIDIL